MWIRTLLAGMALAVFLVACRADEPAPARKSPPAAPISPVAPVLRQKHAQLSAEQRVQLGFPDELIARIEQASGSAAEPFFMTVLMRSENLKGEKGFESKKLAGFSVRTTESEALINSSRSRLRREGYLIFKSHLGYGSLADIVTIIRGNNSYDILKLQGTEAQNYQIGTGELIAWLKARQRMGSFVVTGAGPDWVEARFVSPPKDMTGFARQIAAFAPDVLARGPRTAEKLAEQMAKTNGFYLEWE
jgi:hypothetical protein